MSVREIPLSDSPESPRLVPEITADAPSRPTASEQSMQIEEALASLRQENEQQERLYEALRNYTSPGEPEEMADVLELSSALIRKYEERKELLDEATAPDVVDRLARNAEEIDRNRQALYAAEEAASEQYVINRKPVVEPQDRRQLDGLTDPVDLGPGSGVGPDHSGRPTLSPIDEKLDTPDHDDDSRAGDFGLSV